MGPGLDNKCVSGICPHYSPANGDHGPDGGQLHARGPGLQEGGVEAGVRAGILTEVRKLGLGMKQEDGPRALHSLPRLFNLKQNNSMLNSFSSTVWHSSLTLTERQDLERIQKAAVKVILGNDYDSYTQALSDLKMESLNMRRENMALKFAKKSLENDNFSKLFPLRDINHGMRVRKSEKFHVNNSKTNRYKNSAKPYLQRLLNKENLDKRQSFKRLVT